MKKTKVKEMEGLMKSYLKDVPDKIEHSLNVSEYAYQTAKKIMKNHPEIKIDLEKVKIIGLLHDIGQSRGNHMQHAFEGEKLLKKLGLNEYAEKIVKHGDTHELAQHMGINRDLRPKSLEEKILVYADSHFNKNKFMKPEEKFNFVLGKTEEKFPEILEETKNAIKRLSKIIKEIDLLVSKK